MTGNEQKERLITARYGEKGRPQEIIGVRLENGKYPTLRPFVKQR